jgi:hypothetical protein
MLAIMQRGKQAGKHCHAPKARTKLAHAPK